jgi:hypothetical protein
MLTLVEGTRTWLGTIATRPDRERFERVHNVLEEARRHLHERCASMEHGCDYARNSSNCLLVPSVSEPELSQPRKMCGYPVALRLAVARFGLDFSGTAGSDSP